MQDNASLPPFLAPRGAKPLASPCPEPAGIPEGEGREEEASRALTRRVLVTTGPWLLALLGLVFAAGRWLH